MTAATLASTQPLHYDGASPRLLPQFRAWRRMRTHSGSDQEILQAFLDEQDAALETVRDWVCGHVGSRWRFRDPEAVVQEIVLELLRLARDGRIRRDSSFRAYVQTVARHTCVDQYRRQRLRTSSETEDGFFDSVPDSRPEGSSVSGCPST